MRVRTLVLLLLAVLLAGGTALLARSWLASQKTAAISAAPVPLATPSKSVLVARADIGRGQILQPQDMVWQPWPEGSLDKNYVVLGGPKTPQSFAGWVAKNPIGGGEPVTESNIIAPGNRGFLAAVLRPGMRAISVPVTVTSGISGFIFPGDQVDLLVTMSIPQVANAGKSNYDHKATETVLRDIRVIAIDQRLQSKPGEAVPAHTATFEVTPKQSQIIALASKVGEVSLTLRSLTPAPSETPAADQTAAAGAGQPAPNSSVDATPTYTVDSEISPLLPKYRSAKDVPEVTAITILRGAAKSSEATAAQPASPQPAAQPAS